MKFLLLAWALSTTTLYGGATETGVTVETKERFGRISTAIQLEGLAAEQLFDAFAHQHELDVWQCSDADGTLLFWTTGKAGWHCTIFYNGYDGRPAIEGGRFVCSQGIYEGRETPSPKNPPNCAQPAVRVGG